MGGEGVVSIGEVAVVAVVVAGLMVLEAIVLRLRHRARLRRLAAAIDAVNRRDQVDLTVGTGSDETVLRGIDDLTFRLNVILLEIVAASRKFSLFSADIFYSGGHLSELSDSQADLMESVLERAQGFQESTSDLVSGVGECLLRIQETASRYEELRRRTDSANDHLGPLARSTAEAADLADEGQKHMSISLQETAALRERIANLRDRVEAMFERTSRIGSVLSGVQDIAEKTHVLATNASIEAARAGAWGRGFAVIAAEIRKLSADSRDAITQVEDFLTRTAEDIRDSSRIAEESASRVNHLSDVSDRTGHSLQSIAERMSDISGGMASFREMFRVQTATIQETIDQSESIHRLVQKIGDDIDGHAKGYSMIREQVNAAADGARSAAHSARVLSQLGTYLRTGGHELSHVVDTFRTSEDRLLAGLDRKEPRTTLLYNLEVFAEGSLLGHLGDISPSGLMLYTTDPLPIGAVIDAEIRLPLSFGVTPNVPIRFVPRRMEKAAWFYRIGCSLDEDSTRERREQIDMIITNYTITQGIEQVARDAQDGRADDEGEFPAELEEIQELQEISDSD